VTFPVTVSAEGDQIVFGVITETTPWVLVVDLKVFHCSTLLAAPSISLQNLQAKLTVGFWFKP
jgi:hypothetical protein